MERKANFLQGKGAGWYLAVPAALLAATAALLYQKTGVTEFSPALYPSAVYTAWGAAALSVISLVWNWKPIKYASYLLMMYSFVQYISSQATYIVNVFVSIDGTTFSTGMIATAAAYVLAIVVCLIAAITAHSVPGRKERA